MYFKDRRDAGRQLADILTKYKDEEVVIYALPRGGVVVADEIAQSMNAPIDLILAHKIGHPYQPEYAVAAVSESGHIIGNQQELVAFGDKWLEKEKAHQLEEMKKKREMYLKEKKGISSKGKIAIIVDDGIATGLTMQAGILELKDQNPKKIVIAVPVSPKNTAEKLREMVDDFVGIIVPDSYRFFGSVGAYYNEFSQTEDEEVIAILARRKVIRPSRPE